MHIAVYDKSGSFNTRESRRDRKLLLHKEEIAKISGKVNEKGYTLEKKEDANELLPRKGNEIQ